MMLHVLKMESVKIGDRSVVYEVDFPIQFFFGADERFDGIEVKVDDASERERDLIKELCVLLSKTVDRKPTEKTNVS